MGTRYYPAIIARDKDAFMFQAIDIRGALSAGDTPEDALAHGIEALQLAVDTWDEKFDGPLPPPSSLTGAEAKLDAEDREHLVSIQLTPVVTPEPTVKINVTMPGDLVKRIDGAAGHYGRSSWLADAAREKLASAAAASRLYRQDDSSAPQGGLSDKAARGLKPTRRAKAKPRRRVRG